jgi:outer membrane protein OmpA-like peptidoglycan-associated protein
MDEDKASSQTPENAEQMKQLRKLLLGENNQLVVQTIQENARDVVSEVFSEALLDRQKLDGSVDKVILPLVEKSVEKSVATHSEQFVGYLYPLVGSLVRKSVTAFIGDLLEKTNKLIENSLTVKGMKWRFRAWRSGISFSQYVATQTFSFRVEQVLLIHRETGLLLNTVSYGLESTADADMVSSMLIAINDFVSDSFAPGKEGVEQNLSVIKTDDFTLLIKPGPQAVLVAAVTGSTPQQVADQMQLSIEEIHKLYGKELNAFEGDAVPLENTEQQLRDCLISELKQETSSRKKKPWLAWIVVAIGLAGLGYYATLRWQIQELANRLSQIDQQTGIIVTNIEVLNVNNIDLRILRDPAAISVGKWLEEQELTAAKIVLHESAYLSLESSLVKIKLQNILRNYPQITVDWDNEQPNLKGELKHLDKLRLQQQIDKLVGLEDTADILTNIRITELNSNVEDDPKIIRAVLDLNVAKIDAVQLEFEQGVSSLSENAIEQLVVLANDFKTVIRLAEKQNLAVGLIIMGASDSIGSKSFNQTLSQKRANSVKLNLQELGIDSSRLNAIGLGIIELESAGSGVRKVLFNIVYFDAN